MVQIPWSYYGYEVKENFDETIHPLEIQDRQIGLPSDYLFEITAVTLMANAVDEYKGELTGQNKELDVGLNTFHEFFALSKRRMYELYLSSNENLEKPDDAEKVRQFIKVCQMIKPDDYGIAASDNLKKEWDNTWSQENELFRNSYTKIINYIKKEKHTEQPYRLYQEMAALVSDQAKNRIELVKNTNKEHRYHPNKDQEITASMVLNNDQYKSYTSEAIEKIANHCGHVGSTYLCLKSINDQSFRDTIDEMKNSISNFGSGNGNGGNNGSGGSGDSGGTGSNDGNGGGNDPFKRYHGNEHGCYAIMDTPDVRYYSFSSCFDARNKKILASLNFPADEVQYNKELWRNVKHLIKMLPCPKNKKIYARVNMGTLRYIKGSKSNHIFTIKNKRYKIQSLKRTIRNGKDSDFIQKYYSCCERKIFTRTYGLKKIDCKLFSRHAPCEKCQPGIREFIDRTQCNLEVTCFNLNPKIRIDDDYPKPYDISPLLIP